MEQAWCQFPTDHGFACTLFPQEGRTGLLDPFDVVIDISGMWSDPTGMLADFMRARKTVITTAVAPGIDSNPTVQAWIGAHAPAGGNSELWTTDRDPILGDLSPGTVLGDCADSSCPAVRETAAHPNAQVFAHYVDGGGPRACPVRSWSLKKNGGGSILSVE